MKRKDFLKTIGITPFLSIFAQMGPVATGGIEYVTQSEANIRNGKSTPVKTVRYIDPRAVKVFFGKVELVPYVGPEYIEVK